jgi:hypothetical protein
MTSDIREASSSASSSQPIVGQLRGDQEEET